MLRVGIDIDNIIVQTTKRILDVHYEQTGERLYLDDIKSYYIENFVSPQYRKDFHKLFLDKSVWKDIELVPNCVEVVRQLHNEGYELWFITSTNPENILKKCNHLERTFPFLDVRKHFITTPYKQMIDVDILIDDCADNVVNSKHYSSILFDYPWNRDIDMDKNQNVFRVNGWQDVFQTVKFLEKFIKWQRRKST